MVDVRVATPKAPPEKNGVRSMPPTARPMSSRSRHPPPPTPQHSPAAVAVRAQPRATVATVKIRARTQIKSSGYLPRVVTVTGKTTSCEQWLDVTGKEDFRVGSGADCLRGGCPQRCSKAGTSFR
jgi:hypothetical protein